MFCNNCGTEIKEGGMFCPNCGNKVGGDAPQTWEDAKTVIWSGNTDSMQESGQTAAPDEAPEENSTAEQTDAAKAEESAEGTGGAAAGEGDAVQGEAVQRRFCPNCGTENNMDDTFCKECGMPLQGLDFGMSAAGQGMQANAPLGSQPPKKKKGLLIGLGVAAAVLVLAIGIAAVAMSGLFSGPGGKVLKATIATMNDAPEIVNGLKVIPDILAGNQYTVGFALEYDGDAVSGEFRNTVNDKQVYINADVDGEDIDFLCGVHSSVLKASISDLDYVFMYDPKRENGGYLCKQFRKKQLKEFNSALENITTEKVTAKELQKDITAAFMQEFKELDFKEVKPKEFEVDKKDRECKGYKVRINEKSIARVLEDAGGRISKRLAEEVVDEFKDIMDELIDEVKSDDWDLDVTFYLYKGKLAAVIFEINDYSDEEFCIEFQGGDYRMQNILITAEYDGDVYGEIEVNCHKKGSKETIEMDLDGNEDITITYDTKSGAVSLEYDTRWSDYLIEGTYKYSGSEASFTLEEFEYDGDSLMDDEDISFTMYAKKAVQIEKYNGREFDLGSADEDDIEDLADDLEDYIDLLDYIL